MAKIDYSVYEDKTLEAMNKALEVVQSLEKPRHYLGASEIGHDCNRYLFYSFRNAWKRSIPVSGIKAIQDGYAQEDITIARLRALPFIELVNTDGTFDKDGKPNQIGFKLLLDHFRGHIDGMIKGIVQAPLTWHVWEHKAVNTKKFDELKKYISDPAIGEKNALEKWDYTYYCQAQIYMHSFQLERHYIVVSTPGGLDHIGCRTEYKRSVAEGLIAKAKEIIFDNWSIPAKMSDKREFFKCQWCHMQSVCHDGFFPDVHCKTCRYREPVVNGENKCLLKDVIIEETLLNTGCPAHIYNPVLIPQAKLVEHQDDGCIMITDKGYKFANTSLIGFPDVKGDLDGIFTSIELKEKIQNINNLSIDVVKVQKAFNGKIDDKSKENKPWEQNSKVLRDL